MFETEIVIVSKGLEISPGILSAFEALLPVRFRFVDEIPSDEAGRPLVVYSKSKDDLIEIPRAVRHCFLVQGGGADLQDAPEAGIEFASSMRMDARLRGRRIGHASLAGGSRLESADEDEVLAHHQGQPVWACRHTNDCHVNIVSNPIPLLAPEQAAFDFLNPGHFIYLLPFLQFLREAIGDHGWVPPRLRACFMFDDPNLHWPTYGFVNYQQIADLGRKVGFHAAFATVPFDAWYVNQKTARIFRDNPDNLSLLMHGNDHFREELAAPVGREGLFRLFSQALRRIARLETKSRIRVPRVMAPPHGAVQDEAFDVMLSLGYAGATISAYSVRGWAPSLAGTAHFGLGLAEMAGEGFPVLPRFRLWSGCLDSLVIMSYLDRPLIPVGHHDTLAGGLDILQDVARFINGIGDVSWMNLGEMLEANYFTKLDSNTITIRPFTTAFRVKIPAGVEFLNITSAFKTSASGAPGYSCTNETLPGEPVIPVKVGQLVPVRAANSYFFTLQTAKSGATPAIVSSEFSFLALFRRIACEGRDRVAPFLPRSHRS